jgi:hypothetical protein
MKPLVRVPGLLLGLLPVLLLGCILLMPGIHVVENAFMIAEAGTGNWVPQSSSLVSFKCTQASEGGNAISCSFGHDWTNYYAACVPTDEHCSAGFTAYSTSAARQCTGFEPYNVKTWCDAQR